MARILTNGWRMSLVLVVLVLGIAPVTSPFTIEVAFAQSDLSADPKAVSPTVNDLRSGFQFVPEKSEQREPVPGIVVYEADFVRDQTKANFANGPIEIKSLVARTANSSQATEQFASSRQALTSASPAWVESKVAKLGDDATGLTMEGTSSEGPAVAHLFLFRRGAMVVGITVAGLTKPTRMAEAEAIAAVVLRKIDPSFRSQTGPRQARQLNTQRPAANATGSGSSGASGSGQKVRVYNTGGTGVRYRLEPGLTGKILGNFKDGTTLDVVGDPDRQADGYTWKRVRLSGDGPVWVATNYLQPVSGSASTPSSPPAAASSSTTSAPPPSTAAASSSSSSSSSSSAASSSASNSSASSNRNASTSEQLKVEVNAKQTKLKANQEQTVEIVVTKNGSPVSDASVNVSTMPTGEKPSAPKTDKDGKTRAVWNVSGSPGHIGVGVSALGPDGSTGLNATSW